MNFPWPWLGVTLGGVMMAMFGIVALNEIRRSNCKIRGHGLAFFEIVFFPTLVVNGGMIGLLAWLARGNDIDLFTVLLGIIPLVLVNVLCLRKAWRAASGEDGPHHNLPAGAPLAHLQFSVDKPDELMSVVPFHFASLGYRLIKTDSEEWLFARGKKYAGLWSSDVRGFQTALTVRVGNLQGTTRVDCAWVVRMWGEFYTKSEVKKLEEEGRQLAILLSDVPEESAADEVDDGANNGKSFRRTVLQWLAMAGVLIGGSYAIYAAMTADW